MNILNFSNEMLETILFYIPGPDGSYSNEAAWKPKVLLPLRGINHRFARLIPRIALQKVYFEAYSATQLLSFFNILGRTPVGSTDGAPYISYMKELGIVIRCNPDIPSLLPLSQFRGVFDSAHRMEKLDLQHIPWKAVGPGGTVGDLSFFNCPNLIALKVNQYHPFHNGLFLPLAGNATFPKLKNLHLKVPIHSALNYLQLAAGIERRSLDRFVIWDAGVSPETFSEVVLQHLQDLRALELWNFEQYEPAVCANVVKYCRKLESLFMFKLNDTCVEALCSQVPATSSQKETYSSKVTMNILNFSNEMLETILSYIPGPDGSYSNEAAWKPKVLLPLRGINHRFARLIPRIALQKVYFEAYSATQLLSFFNILGRTPVGSTDGAPYISYMKELGIVIRCNPDIPSLLPLSQFRGVFDSAHRMEKLDLQHISWKAVGPGGTVGDLSFFNCPNLIALKVNQYHPFHNGLFLPLADDATFPKLKNLHLKVPIHSALNYLELAAGIERRSLDRFAIWDAGVSPETFGEVVLPHLHDLRALELGNFEQSEPAVCANVAKYCRKLEYLSMIRLDDACVEALCSQVPATSSQECFTNSIRNIKITFGSVTTASIPNLIRLPRLKKIEIRVLRSSKDAFEMLQQALPAVVRRWECRRCS